MKSYNTWTTLSIEPRAPYFSSAAFYQLVLLWFSTERFPIAGLHYPLSHVLIIFHRLLSISMLYYDIQHEEFQHLDLHCPLSHVLSVFSSASFYQHVIVILWYSTWRVPTAGLHCPLSHVLIIFHRLLSISMLYYDIQQEDFQQLDYIIHWATCLLFFIGCFLSACDIQQKESSNSWIIGCFLSACDI